MRRATHIWSLAERNKFASLLLFSVVQEDISKHQKAKVFAQCFSKKSLECFSPIKEINRTVGFIHNWKLGKLPNPLWCRALKWRDFEEIFKYPPVWVALNRSTSLCRPKPPHPLQLCHRFNPKWDFEWTNISSSRNTKMIDTLRTSNLTSVLFILVCLKLPWNHRVIWKYTL